MNKAAQLDYKASAGHAQPDTKLADGRQLNIPASYVGGVEFTFSKIARPKNIDNDCKRGTSALLGAMLREFGWMDVVKMEIKKQEFTQ